MSTTYILLIIAVIAIGFFLMNRSGGGGNYQNIDVAELKAMMKEKDVILIDVRTPQEIKNGTIGKPKKIELNGRFTANAKDLSHDKKYVLYCRSGRRSALASKMFSGLGYDHVYNLKGGIQAWNSHK